MEDISRELEREIARAKPSPHKTNRQKRILIVDDFGELSSGGYLKVLVYLFLAVSLVGIMGTAGFYTLFAKAQRENLELTDRLAVLEKKADRLTNDKEILMARLVMSGKKPDLDRPEVVQVPPAKEKQPGIMPKQSVEKKSQEKQAAEKEGAKTPAHPVAVTQPEPPVPPVSMPDPPVEPKAEVSVVKPVVSVEKFSVIRGKTSEELVVKFNIRNISKESKEISGRIFAVLKPENGEESGWVVSPGGIMKNGMPGPYRKGQYFSISRFKPVKFTIKNQASPDSFTTAAIYIFGDQENLLFENTIQINGAK